MGSAHLAGRRGFKPFPPPLSSVEPAVVTAYNVLLASDALGSFEQDKGVDFS